MSLTGRRLRVALVNDYEIVVRGLARMLEPFSDRVDVVELDARERVGSAVDVALYDTFAQPQPDDEDVSRLVSNPLNRHVAVFTWKMDQDLIDAALERGATGYLPKSLNAAHLVADLERVAAGERVIHPARARVRSAPGISWPGQHLGISDRESEILGLITQGRSNADIAVLTHLSPNTVKTHIRALYAKIGAENRVDAVLWGTENGFRPDHRSVLLARGQD
ncbi:LuxR C-terminal-related transcriptional regulator [Microbacterium sp. NPDC007973]|uniref:response regulator transcription factor n=1 Tax=Microbacterium sp. NPDC007973 TaxID=3364182 RepID=UPI0036E37122